MALSDAPFSSVPLSGVPVNGAPLTGAPWSEHWDGSVTRARQRAVHHVEQLWDGLFTRDSSSLLGESLTALLGTGRTSFFWGISPDFWYRDNTGLFLFADFSRGRIACGFCYVF